MSPDFTTSSRYIPAEATTHTERELRGHLLAAKRADDRGAADVAHDHRMAAQLLRKHTPVETEPSISAVLRTMYERNRKWCNVGGDPINSIDKEKSNAQ
jgi:hypothetical protein